MEKQAKSKWAKKLMSKTSKASAIKIAVAGTVLVGLGVGIAFAIKESNKSEDKLSSEEKLNQAFIGNQDEIFNILKRGSSQADIAEFEKGEIKTETTIDEKTHTGITKMTKVKDPLGTTSVKPHTASSLLWAIVVGEIGAVTFEFDLETGNITKITKQTYSDTTGGLNAPVSIADAQQLVDINAIVADEIKAAAPPKAPTTPSTGSWSRTLPTVPVYKKSTGTNEFTTVKTEGENYSAGQPGQSATLPATTGNPSSIKIDGTTLTIKADATVYDPALPAGDIYLKKGGSATEYTQVKTDGDGYVQAVAEVPATVNGTSLGAGTGGSAFDQSNITLGTSGNGYVAHVAEVKDSVNGTSLSTAGLDFSIDKVTLGTSGNGYVAHVPEVKDKIGSTDLTTVGAAFVAANIEIKNTGGGDLVMGSTVSIFYSSIDTGQTYDLTEDAAGADLTDPANITATDKSAIETLISGLYVPGNAETTGKNPVLYDGAFTGVVQDGAPDLAAAKSTATSSHTWYIKGNAETTGKNPVLYSGIYTGVVQDGAPDLAAAKSTASSSHAWYVSGNAEIVGQNPTPVVPDPTKQSSITIVPSGGGSAATYTAKTAADWDWSLLNPPSQPAKLFIKKGTTNTNYDYVTNETLAEGYLAEVMPIAQSEADLQAAATDPSNFDNKIMIDGSEYIWSTTKSAVVSVKPPGAKTNSFYMPIETFKDLYFKK